MFSYFKDRKTTYFYVFCLNFRNENQNYISNFIFQFIKKNEMALRVHGFLMIQKFHFFLSFLIYMRTFQTDNRTFKIRIMTIDQCSLNCCSGVILTLSQYLSEKLYHYTNHDLFFRIRLVATSLFFSYCIHVSSSGDCESSFSITDAS